MYDFIKNLNKPHATFWVSNDTYQKHIGDHHTPIPKDIVGVGVTVYRSRSSSRGSLWISCGEKTITWYWGAVDLMHVFEKVVTVVGIENDHKLMEVKNAVTKEKVDRIVNVIYDMMEEKMPHDYITSFAVDEMNNLEDRFAYGQVLEECAFDRFLEND